MGYRGKVTEREQARVLRSEGWTMPEIAAELQVSKGSVSLWTRDVEFTPRRGRAAPRRRSPNKLQRAKAAQIEQLLLDGQHRIGRLSEREFLVAGTALYAGEGSKTNGTLSFANSDPRMIAFAAALDHWSRLTRIPLSQFTKPYRAVPDPSIRTSRHPRGCPSVAYSCSTTYRAVMGLVEALLASDAHSGVAQSAEQGIVNPKVVGSSPTPGAFFINRPSPGP